MGIEFEETKKKIHLAVLDPGRKKLVPSERATCTVSKKYGTMNLGKQAIDAMNMRNSWFKLAYDSTKQIIAWKVRKELHNDHLQETGWKFCKADEKKSGGQAIIGVGRILDTMPGLKDEVYKNLEIKKYRDNSLVGDGDDTNFWYYVQIEDFNEPEKIQD